MAQSIGDGPFEVKLRHAIEKKESMVQALKECNENEKKREILQQLAELEGQIADECAAELLTVERDEFLDFLKRKHRQLGKKRA